MPYDALFQSGMGAVVAPRTEDRLTNQASSEVSRVAFSRRRAPAMLFRRTMRSRGNSAKAPMHRRLAGAVPG